MPATIQCQPCCTTPQSVDIPGVEGSPGIDGTNGLDAYTTVTADFIVPAAAANVTVAVVNALWMQVGQVVVFSGPANFQVVSVDSATQATLQYLDYAGDVAVGSTITSGTGVGPGGLQGDQGAPGAFPAPLTIYASGTPYTLTNASALLDFGTTDPVLTLGAAGNYLIFARVRYDYNAATFAAERTVTTKLRRTNNTPADISDSPTQWQTAIITTKTYTAHIFDLQPIGYTTATAGDILELWGDIDVVPSAGSLDAVEASIVALPLF